MLPVPLKTLLLPMHPLLAARFPRPGQTLYLQGPALLKMLLPQQSSHLQIPVKKPMHPAQQRRKDQLPVPPVKQLRSLPLKENRRKRRTAKYLPKVNTIR